MASQDRARLLSSEQARQIVAEESGGRAIPDEPKAEASAATQNEAGQGQGVHTQRALAELGGGLTYSLAEVNAWRERAKVGPYRRAGDAQTHSPGDYDRIMANAKAFEADPAASRWNGGFQGKGCVPGGTSDEIMSYEPKERGDKLRDAAFIALLDGKRSLGRLVLDELLSYAKNPLLDFSDQARWCLGSKSVRDFNPGFLIAEWLSKMLYAYDYSREFVAKDEAVLLEEWFLKAGLYFQKVNDEPTDGLYVDRQKGLLKDPGRWSATVVKSHDNGYDIPMLAKHYNNRRGSIARLVAQVGALSGNDVLLKSARLFFTDWMKYAIFPDGTMSEYYRGDASKLETGYHYTLITIALMLETADIFARTGDTTLYDYETSEGIMATKGGRKNLHLVLTRIEQMIDGSIKRFLPGYPNQDYYRLDGIDPARGNREFIFDIWFASANLYYRDPYIRSIYLREAPGTHPYPKDPANVGAFHPWSSTHATMPGVLFMRSKFENRVLPYPSLVQPHGQETSQLLVKAKGTAVNGAPALMRVYANGVLVGQTYAAAATRADHFVVGLAAPAIEQVMIEFANAAAGSVGGSLTVESIQIGSGTPIATSPSSASFDKGELDGQNTMAAQATVTEQGFLIFKIK